MQTPPIDARALAQSGVEALRRGDPHKARESFERAVAAGLADATTCLGLAYACRSLKEYSAAHAAIDKALALEPRNPRALILKADHLAAEGDERAASSFYLAAIKAAPPADQLPLELRQELGRAQAMCERYAAKFESFLHDRLRTQDLAEEPFAARFLRSLDILSGKKKVYYQQPRYYFFPELPQVQFYDRNAFPWLDKVEAATGEIRAELIEVLKDPSKFKPYVQGEPRRPHNEQEGMLNNPAWSAFYLWQEGHVVAENAARCPATMSALADAPLSRVKNRSPSVLFSLLRPGARIPPHTGFVNTRLICHLPLIVPRDCGFRVGNETRTPVEGKAWVFDDTMEHEAWNRSDQIRAILLFEVWRPELTQEERSLVSAMFEAIDAHTGEKAAWAI
ncbi:MAG TPA: aspartyl/asparaginyl beta-hydroxylase domain-containing protein [Burkholderiales bacterium]|nr:aspartyl/asparaginyl beta-hydroxylase domain-containing protein [Burkholderiales bacterium]